MSVKYRPIAFVLILVGATVLGYAQAPPGQGRGGQTVEKIRTLKPNLYMVTGGGANTLIRVTPDGLNRRGHQESGRRELQPLMEEIKSVSTLPVKWVINTQHHPDHVGTNQKFIDAGAQVLALESLKTWMASDPRTKAIPGLPTQTLRRTTR
jgi:glyoxylase-like metal-dependent hydrolase (beta-lactamase superfamily II)